MRPFRNASHAAKNNVAASSSLRPTILTTASVCMGWMTYTTAEANAAERDPNSPSANRNTSQPFSACNNRFVIRKPGAHTFQIGYSSEKVKIVRGR